MSTTQRLLDAQGIPATSFVNVVGGSDSILPNTAGLTGGPGPAVTEIEQTVDNALGQLGAAVPIEALRDPYGNYEPDGDELTDPQELSELPTLQGLVHQLPDIAHNPVTQAANCVAAQVGAAAGCAAGAVGLSHTAGDILGFTHAVGSDGQTVPQQVVDSIAKSGDQVLTDVADIGANAHMLVDNLINDAPGELLGAQAVNHAVNGVVCDINHALGDLQHGPIIDVNVLPNGVMGSSGVLHVTVDPSQPSLVTVDALASPHDASSHIIDADALPRSIGDVLDVSALTSPEPGEGAISAILGNGPSVLEANILTGTLPNAFDPGQGIGGVLGGLTCGPEGLLGSLKSSDVVEDVTDVAHDVFGSCGPSGLVGSLKSSDLISDVTDIVRDALGSCGNGQGIGGILGNCSPTPVMNALAAVDRICVPNLCGAGADGLVGALTHDIACIAQAAVTPVADLAGVNSCASGLTSAALPAVDLHDISQPIQQVANAVSHLDVHALI
jgi:hypothetical protein